MVNLVHYGATRLEEKLGAASYTLVANGPHDLFTFCMCAGGYIMPSVSAAASGTRRRGAIPGSSPIPVGTAGTC